MGEKCCKEKHMFSCCYKDDICFHECYRRKYEYEKSDEAKENQRLNRERIRKKYNCTEEKAKEISQSLYIPLKSLPIPPGHISIKDFKGGFSFSEEPVILNDSWIDNLKGIKDD